MRVVIADDDAVERFFLSTTLQSAGFEVSQAGDGVEALETFGASQALLGVIDWHMPRLDGVKLLRSLAEQAGAAPRYLIVLTADHRMESMIAALANGASDFLTKPFSPVELIARVKLGQRTIDLQQQVLQMQKLDAVGRLAAGLAHELNTPAQFVGDNLRFLQSVVADYQTSEQALRALLCACEKGGAPPSSLVFSARAAVDQAGLQEAEKETLDAIAQSIDGVARIAKIVATMKEFSPPGGSKRISVDLNRAIEVALTVSRHEWEAVAKIELDLGSTPRLQGVLCLANELNEALLHLFINAAQAIAERYRAGQRGHIRLRTRQIDDVAEIQVQDDGAGIPAAIHDRIFDPFFTTKDVGKGTGQGLAIAYDTIVRKHGGSIKVESEVGRGTTFTLRIPLEPCGGERQRTPDGRTKPQETEDLVRR